MNELKELLIKAFNLEIDDSQDAEPNTYLFNYEYDVTDALNTAMQLIAQFTTRKELEAKIDELERLYLVYGSPEQPATLDNVFILGEKGKTATLPVKDRLTQLSTELSNKKKEQ